jgi:hypothetical protein
MLPFFYSLGVSMRKTHLIVNGISTSRYPLTLKVGTIGKYHPSRKPTLQVTNSYHVGETARTFGVRSNHMINCHVLSPAVKPKKQ